ncbi:SusE domain-containing protein [Spirosoma areae]
MKSLVYNLLAAGMALVAFSSCEKEEDRLVLQPGNALTITPSTTTVALKNEDAAKEALALTWSAAQYGFGAATNYTVQFGKKGNSFKDSIDVSALNATKLSVTGADLNQMMLKLGIPAGSAGQLDVRVKSEISRPNDGPSNRMYSAATTITGTPYLVIIEYPSLWVPGDYQGWAPDKAPKIASAKSNGVYEGYVNFSKATPFKFTSAPNWDKTNYGTGGAGKLSTTGDNLTIPAAGYYLLKADVNALTWSATPTVWSVIGAATPKGWDAGTPLTYDAATGTWKVTLDLKQDELKFRANDAWDINFGDTKADGLLEYGGDNIKVPSAGKYLVTLNLGVGGNYTYTLTKQ